MAAILTIIAFELQKIKQKRPNFIDIFIYDSNFHCQFFDNKRALGLTPPASLKSLWRPVSMSAVSR